MRKTLYKWYWMWDFDKEEAWLNHMAQQGYVLDAVSLGRYEFRPCELGEYVLRLELIDNWPGSEKGRDYIGFVESTGAECVGSIQRWVYFRKKVADGSFDLFSDIDSRIRHLNRMIWLPLLFIPMNLSNGFNTLVQGLNFHDGVNTLVVCGMLSFAVVGLLLYGAVRIALKRHALVRERSLHE